LKIRKEEIMITRKSRDEIKKMRHAGHIVALVHKKMKEVIEPGISTKELDSIAMQIIKENKAIPTFLGYHGFPGCICASINEQVVHGIPSEDEIIKNGDIINVDVTTILNGYFADASRMYMIGDVKEEDRKLVEVTKECLELGLKEVKPWGRLGNIGYVIDKHASEHGYQVVADIGGHGTGIEFHEDPYVCHIGQKDTGMLLVPGMVFTIEPMINMGEEDFYTDEENGWTVRTNDGKPSAQWEYTILVTETGAEILTY
jgi:methionyl aminopeptidase